MDTEKVRTPSGKEALDRFSEARRNLQRLKKTIAPFSKRRPAGARSTAGQWCETKVDSVCEVPECKAPVRQ